MELCAVASWEKTSQGRRSHHASAPGLLPAYFSLQFLAVVQHLVVLSSFLFWYFVKTVNILLNTFIFIIQTACPLSADLSQNATDQFNIAAVILLVDIKFGLSVGDIVISCYYSGGLAYIVSLSGARTLLWSPEVTRPRFSTSPVCEVLFSTWNSTAAHGAGIEPAHVHCALLLA